MKKPKQPFEPEEDDVDSPQIIGIGLDDDLEDEDIIDLNEIVGLDEELAEDEEQVDVEVELLDAAPELSDPDSPLEEDSDDVLDGDLLKGLVFSEEESPTAVGELGFVGEGKDEGLDDLLRFSADAAGDDEKDAEAEDLLFGESKLSAVAEEASSASEAALDEALSRMEDRLAQTIREIVDARLPEIVRSILQEEIRRLKDEIK